MYIYIYTCIYTHSQHFPTYFFEISPMISVNQLVPGMAGGERRDHRPRVHGLRFVALLPGRSKHQLGLLLPSGGHWPKRRENNEWR